MELKDVLIPYKMSDPDFELYALGDIHAGTIHCMENRVQAKVAEIARNKRAKWIGMGDYAEFITPSDPRWDPSQRSIAGWVEPDNIAETQTKWVVNLFKPIKDKCIGLLYGNHEESIRRHNHDNVHKNICDRLGVDNLGFASFIRFYFRRENSKESHMITGVFTHGRTGAITSGAKLNMLLRFMNQFGGKNVLMYAYAHVHDILTTPRPYLTPGENRFGQGELEDQTEWGAMTGSWFRTYTQGIHASYGEQKLYPASTIGCVVFKINPSENRVEAVRSV